MNTPLPKHPLRLALWQTPYPATVQEGLQALDAAATRARSLGADVLVCPEMSLTGYLIAPERLHSLAEPSSGPLLAQVGRIAQRHQLAVLCGWPLQVPRGCCNAVALVGADGTLVGSYAKTHLFGPADHARFVPGDARAPVWHLHGWNLGVLICYDVEFPETVRALALSGAHAVLVPTANMLQYPQVQNLLVPARACENRLYVAYANACGHEGDTQYGGNSLVCGPGGEVLARAGLQETLQLVTLQSAALATARLSSPLPDRRSDLYG